MLRGELFEPVRCALGRRHEERQLRGSGRYWH